MLDVHEKDDSNIYVTKKVIDSMPHIIYPGGCVHEWEDSVCWDWLEENIGVCGEDWFDCGSDYTARVSPSREAEAKLMKMDFWIRFSSMEDAAEFRAIFDFRN